MVHPSPVDPSFGPRMRALRHQRGLSLRALEVKAKSNRSSLSEYETGRTMPSAETARLLDDALGAGGELVLLPRQRAVSTARDCPLGAAAPLVEHLRRALIARRMHGSLSGEESLNSVEAVSRTAHNAYQRCEYATVATLLPPAIAVAEHHARDASDEVRRRAHHALAIANVAASKLAAKIGDGALAWMTADRATSSVLHAEDHALSGIAAYQIACALLRMPDRLDDAQNVVAGAVEDLGRVEAQARQVDLSTWGSLLLLSAIVAARQGDRTAATRMLAAAEALADRLREDRNDLWSGFGPTNVAIHKVSVAVELRQPDMAIEMGEGLDTTRLPAALVGRRAQVHLDLAAAFALKRDDAPAVLHLLEAERIASQVIKVNHAARALLVELLRHERRVRTPGLRPLAERAGVVA